MILTLDEAKAINPALTQSDLDGFEQLVRQYTLNNFQVQEARLFGLTFDANGVTDYTESANLYQADHRPHRPAFSKVKSAPIEWFSVGNTVEVNGTDINDGVYTISAINGKAVTLAGQMIVSGTFPDGFLTLIRYPADIRTGIVKLMKYDLKMGTKVGIKMESVARMRTDYYDISTQMTGEGYPQAMVSFLDKYRKLRL